MLREMADPGGAGDLHSRVEASLRAACSQPDKRSLENILSRLAAGPAAGAALEFAAARLALDDETISVPALLDVLEGTGNASLREGVRRSVVGALAAELAGLDPTEALRPRCLEVLRSLAARCWLDVRGAAAVVEELVASWRSAPGVSEGSAPIPPCIAVLEALVEVLSPAEVVHALTALAPESSRLLTERHREVITRFPGLCVVVPQLPRCSAHDKDIDAGAVLDSGSDTGPFSEVMASIRWSKPTRDSAGSSTALFEAVEEIGSSASASDRQSFVPFCLQPAYLPSETLPGVCHSGLLLGGSHGIVEEWDLDAGFRLDRLRVDGLDDQGQNEQAMIPRHKVVSLMCPDYPLDSRQPDELVVGAVNTPDGAGLAVLRRDRDTRTLQVEAPWPPQDGILGARRVDRMSRGDFLHSSRSALVVGQTSSLGACEVALYDVAAESPRSLAVCSSHSDLVVDVCSLSAQTCASAGLDGALLIWDLRCAQKPASRASFGDAQVSGLSSVTAPRGSRLLVCGSLTGEMTLFDSRAASRPLSRLHAAAGAVVRLLVWMAGPSDALIAAVSCAEQGLCSVAFELHDGKARSSPVQRASYRDYRGSIGEGTGQQLRRCYDVARPLGGADAVLACGEWGITRYRVVRTAVD